MCPLCAARPATARTIVCRDYEHESRGWTVFVMCGECGLVVQHPPPGRDELLNAYPDDYHAYHENSDPLTMRIKRRYYRRRARQYGRLLGHRVARVLDVGCGDGSFVEALGRCHPGWRTSGIDFNPRIVERARARGLDVEVGVLEETGHPDETFDLIVMNHMIEHAFDPLATFAFCRRLLRPGGVLVGETPNVDCWDFNVFGGYWGGLHAPRHTMLFNPRTIRRAAERAGLETVSVKHVLQPAHLALSVQHWLQSRRLTRTSLRRGRAFYYPYLLLLFLPIAALQVLCKRSGVVNFAFRRPCATKR